MRKFILIIPMLLYFFACSDSPSTGVTDSGNYVSGKVLSSDMEVLTGITVYLIKPEVTTGGAIFSVLDSAVTDDVGVWEMNYESGNYTLLSKGNESVAPAMKKIIISSESSAKNIVIHQADAKTVFGRAFIGADLSAASVDVAVMGTDIKATTLSDGRYILSNMPTGEYDLLYSFDGRNYVSSIRTSTGDSYVYVRDITLPSTKTDSLAGSEYDNAQKVTPVVYEEEPEYYYNKNFDGVEYLASSVAEAAVIDYAGEIVLPFVSFDYDNNETLIHENRSESDLNSVWIPYILDTDSLSNFTVSLSQGVWGDALFMDFMYGDSTMSTAGGVTVFFDWISFAGQNRNVDLSLLRSIEFYLKGDCDVKIMLQDSSTVANGGWGMFAEFEKIISPTKEWQYYSIPIEELICSEIIDSLSTPLNREEDIKKIEYLKFMTVANPGDTVHFAIDEISLSGVTQQDL